MIAYFANKDWKEGTIEERKTGYLLCIACNDGTWRRFKNCERHEKSEKHKTAVLNLSFLSEEVVQLEKCNSPTSRSLPTGSSVPGPISRALSTLRTHSNDGGFGGTHIPDDFYFNSDHSDVEINSQRNDDITSFPGITLETSVYKSIISDTSSALDNWLQTGPDIVLETYSDDNGELSEDSDSDDEYILGTSTLVAHNNTRELSLRHYF